MVRRGVGIFFTDDLICHECRLGWATAHLDKDVEFRASDCLFALNVVLGGLLPTYVKTESRVSVCHLTLTVVLGGLLPSYVEVEFQA